MTDVAAVGIAVETDGVDKGIKKLAELAQQGPKVEQSMAGISAESILGCVQRPATGTESADRAAHQESTRAMLYRNGRIQHLEEVEPVGIGDPTEIIFKVAANSLSDDGEQISHDIGSKRIED